eukprot:751052-Hanusia_phi.AAC.1
MARVRSMSFVGVAPLSLDPQPSCNAPARTLVRPLSVLRMQGSEGKFPRRKVLLGSAVVWLSLLGGQLAVSKEAAAAGKPDANELYAVDPSGFRYQTLKDGIGMTPKVGDTVRLKVEAIERSTKNDVSRKVGLIERYELGKGDLGRERKSATLLAHCFFEPFLVRRLAVPCCFLE